MARRATAKGPAKVRASPRRSARAKPRAAAPTIYPALFYRDPRAALQWLQQAFGFRERFVVDAPDGGVAHAELALGTGLVMLGGAQEDKGWRSPKDLEGVHQGLYLYVRDPDGHFRRAKAAGAFILYPPRDTEYGSREYGCKDPEGHFWSFGTYRPRP